jgi:hypothetical protein
MIALHQRLEDGVFERRLRPLYVLPVLSLRRPPKAMPPVPGSFLPGCE